MNLVLVLVHGAGGAPSDWSSVTYRDRRDARLVDAASPPPLSR